MTRNTLAQLKLGSCWPETTIACRASFQIVYLFPGLRALHRLFLGLFLGCGGFFSLVQSRLVHHGTGIAETGIKEGLAARSDQGTGNSTPLCHLIADQGENTASTTTSVRRPLVRCKVFASDSMSLCPNSRKSALENRQPSAMLAWFH